MMDYDHTTLFGRNCTRNYVPSILLNSISTIESDPTLRKLLTKRCIMSERYCWALIYRL